MVHCGHIYGMPRYLSHEASSLVSICEMSAIETGGDAWGADRAMGMCFGNLARVLESCLVSETPAWMCERIFVILIAQYTCGQRLSCHWLSGCYGSGIHGL